jgi:hypothetical protein
MLTRRGADMSSLLDTGFLRGAFTIPLSLVVAAGSLGCADP